MKEIITNHNTYLMMSYAELALLLLLVVVIMVFFFWVGNVIDKMVAERKAYMNSLDDKGYRKYNEFLKKR